MSGYRIDRDVPLPKRGYSRYPFADMSVGDSFLVPNAEADKGRRAAYMHARRHGQRFVTRSEADGVRIWRVE